MISIPLSLGSCFARVRRSGLSGKKIAIIILCTSIIFMGITTFPKTQTPVLTREHPFSPSDAPSINIPYESGWNVSWGGSGVDIAHDVATDEAGNVYVVGSRGGTMVLVKFNCNGTVEWNRTVSNSITETYSLATSSPDIVVVAGGAKVYLYGASGSVNWSRNVDAAGYFMSVAVHPTSGIYLAYFSTNIIMGYFIATKLNLEKYYLNGTVAWNEVKELSSDPPDSPWVDVDVDSLGNVYITARLDVYFTTYSYTYRYNAAGNEIWAHRINLFGDYDVRCYAIAVGGTDDIYVVGNDFLYKMNSTGDHLWTRVISGLTGVDLLPSGDVLVTGSIADGVNGDLDVLIARYAANGSSIWNQTWGGSGDDIARAIAIGSDETAYLAGCRNNDILVVQFTPGVPHVPGIPTGIKTASGNVCVNITWNAPYDGWTPITGYRLYWSADGMVFTTINLGDVLTYAHNGLMNNQTYWYKVAAINAIGQGGNSSTVVATPGVPARIEGVVAIGGKLHVNLTWVMPDGNGFPITGYVLYWSVGGTTFEKINLGLVVAYQHNGLVPGQVYCYRIAAVNEISEGVASETVSAMTWTLPEAPSLTIETSLRTAAKEISMSWSIVQDVEIYVVYRYAQQITQENIHLATVVGTSSETKFTNVVPEPGVYWYAVVAVNATGSSEPSNSMGVLIEEPDNTGLLVSISLGIGVIVTMFGVILILLRRAHLSHRI